MPVSISIVTPSFNQAAYLQRTLQSIISQRQHVHEYFVIDGGSTDGSTTIIEQHSDQIDHWVSEPDRGQGDAIAKGFSRATGDVLYWLNSDDILLPHALEKVKRAFESNPRLDVVTGWPVVIDADDRIVQLHRRPHDSPRWMQWGYMRIYQPCCFFRRRAYEAVGGIDLDLHCVLDTDLWYRMAMHTIQNGGEWGGVHDYLAALRMHPQTKGATLHDQYQAERNLMKSTCPQFTANRLRHSIGRFGYYFSQLVSGRFAANRRDRSHYAGKPWQEVFCDSL